MRVSCKKLYKHSDIANILKKCVLCGSSYRTAYWSQVAGTHLDKGREGMSCEQCQLELCFLFNLDNCGEIIDEYSVEYLKLGKVQYVNDNNKFSIFYHNTYLKDLAEDVLDLDNFQKLMMVG